MGGVAKGPNLPDTAPGPAMAADAFVPELDPTDVADRLRGPEPPLLIDVREPWEHRIANVAGARLIPLNSLPAALSTLDPAADYVVMCHHGARSMNAARFLRGRGFARVANLRGGIAAWSDEVDPAVPQY